MFEECLWNQWVDVFTLTLVAMFRIVTCLIRPKNYRKCVCVCTCVTQWCLSLFLQKLLTLVYFLFYQGHSGHLSSRRKSFIYAQSQDGLKPTDWKHSRSGLWRPLPLQSLMAPYSLCSALHLGSRVAQQFKALHLNARGATTVPGLNPSCITSGCDLKSHRAAHNWPSVVQVWLG